MIDFKQELLPILPNLRAFARSLCGDAEWANDLVQESVLRAWASQESYRNGTNLKAWMFTILRNHFYNELRKRKRSVERSFDDTMLTAGAAESQITALHLQDLVRELRALPDDQREALLLVSVEGFSYEEVAHINGCAVGTVKSRVARARRELEARLGGPDIGLAASAGVRLSPPLTSIRNLQ